MYIHGTVRGKGVEKKPEQDAAASPRVPYGAAEDAVIVHEVALARATSDPQKACHGAPARGQNGADQQGPSVPPGAVDEQGRERQDDPGEAGGPVWHRASLGRDTTSLPVVPASSPTLTQPLTRMAKLELKACSRFGDERWRPTSSTSLCG